MVLDPNDFQEEDELANDTSLSDGIDEEDEDEDGLEDELESDEDDSIEEI